MDIEKRILLALKYCNQTSPVILTNTAKQHEEKSNTVNVEISRFAQNDEAGKEWIQIFEEKRVAGYPKPENIFPWKDELSESIDVTAFEASFLTQPDLFLRIRPGFEKTVLQKLQAAKIDFILEEKIVRLSNTTKVDNLLQINKEAVIQDRSSQKISELLKAYKSQISNLKSTVSVWDCCAASGGKSILANDVLENMQLTVSDIRPSIISNLKKRFSEAGIKNYKAFVADIANNGFHRQKDHYDLVIADVPCTGSGTWARTPEQLFYFEKEKIDEYAALQKNILKTIIPFVKPKGFLLYITCSAFKKENEGQIKWMEENRLTCLHQKIFKGYNERADTMFATLLQKN